jgi:hypothetical protein
MILQRLSSNTPMGGMNINMNMKGLAAATADPEILLQVIVCIFFVLYFGMVKIMYECTYVFNPFLLQVVIGIYKAIVGLCHNNVSNQVSILFRSIFHLIISKVLTYCIFS